MTWGLRSRAERDQAGLGLAKLREPQRIEGRDSRRALPVEEFGEILSARRSHREAVAGIARAHREVMLGVEPSHQRSSIASEPHDSGPSILDHRPLGNELPQTALDASLNDLGGGLLVTD